MKSKLEICDEANQRFKELINKNKNKNHYLEKFQYLPYWLDDVSYYFSLEGNNKLLKNYYYFRRGSVIRVNFGVNVGSEFSNIHFAIVLDKKDSNHKKTLTVLPLTSKQKHARYSLGKEIFKQTITVLKKNIEEQKEAILKIKREKDACQKKNNEIYNRLIILKDEISKFNQSFDNPEEIEKKSQNISKEISFLQEDQRINDKLVKLIENELIKKENEVNQLLKVFSIYKKYNKNSYVRLSDITTISKLRIERINKFDPSGKIRLTDEQMKGINDQLMRLYISN